MPSSKAMPITLSSRQQVLLKQMVRGGSNPHRLVRRANWYWKQQQERVTLHFSQHLELDRGQVRLWRNRWLTASVELAVAEIEEVSDEKLTKLSEQVLSDEAREGTPNFFNTEQVIQIVALACEKPRSSERPVSHWTATELAQEAVQRSIGATRTEEDFVQHIGQTVDTDPDAGWIFRFFSI